MDSIDIVRKQVWNSAYVKNLLLENEAVIARIAQVADLCTEAYRMVRRHYLLVMVVVLPMLSTLLASWSVNSILIARGFLQLR